MRREVERICNELALADPQQTSTLVPPGRPAQLDELARRRAQQIAANLENAERAFELGDYDAGLAACEDALIIDPREPRALEGLQRAHAALSERQALAHLNAARQHFAKDELTLAEDALRAASELAPALHEVVDLHEQVGSARQKKEQRIRALKLALDRARIRCGEGAYESAINAANEALEHNPHDAEAQRLKAEALSGLKGERQREIGRRAQAAVDEAARLAARDQFNLALHVLSDDAIAAHPLTDEARARIQNAHAEFNRLTQETAARAEAARIEAAQAEAARVEAARPDTQHLAETVTITWGATPLPLEAQPRAPAETPSAPDLPQPQPQAPRWLLLSPGDSPGFLPGPIRRRRPRPPRRPVQFLDREPDRGGQREWFHEQLFVGAKQGHDSVGFGVSLTTHVVVVTVGILVLLSRAAMVTPPPEKPPLVMMTESLPRPPVVDSTPPRATAPPKPKTEALHRTAPAPIAAAESTPAPAPVEAPATLPTIDSPATTTQIAVEAPKAVVAAPPLAVRQLETMTEVPVDDFDQNPVLLKKVEPKYPEGASGEVRVQVTILSNGRVSRVRVLDSTPYAALITEAAEQSVFQPAKRRGRPVTIVYVLIFQFNTRK